MKLKRIIISTLLIVILVPVVYLIGTNIYIYTFGKDLAPNAFISKWVEIFSDFQSPRDINKIKLEERPDLIVVREFLDSSWIAATCNFYMQDHWSAIVMVDSTGKICSSRKIISGYEALYGEIQNIKAHNLKDFYKGFSEYKCKFEKNIKNLSNGST